MKQQFKRAAAAAGQSRELETDINNTAGWWDRTSILTSAAPKLPVRFMHIVVKANFG